MHCIKLTLKRHYRKEIKIATNEDLFTLYGRMLNQNIWYIYSYPIWLLLYFKRDRDIKEFEFKPAVIFCSS